MTAPYTSHHRELRASSFSDNLVQITTNVSVIRPANISCLAEWLAKKNALADTKSRIENTLANGEAPNHLPNPNMQNNKIIVIEAVTTLPSATILCPAIQTGNPYSREENHVMLSSSPFPCSSAEPI